MIPNTIPYKLGIIAGGGSLPFALAEAAEQQGQDLFIIALKGSAEQALCAGRSHFWASVGKTGAVIARLKQEGVTHLVFAGSVKRPSLKSIRLDFSTFWRLLKRRFHFHGDDAILRFIHDMMTSEGFQVVGAHDICPELLMPDGHLTQELPKKAAMKDIAYGVRIAKEMGRLDIGQSVIVQDGMVLGVEAIEGTDALVRRCAVLKRKKANLPILVKMCKPHQLEAIDLPTIGLETVKAVHEAGYQGIAIEAGKALLLDAADVVAYADKHDLFVMGIKESDLKSDL
ncbi:MAG: UDP-2,3-diacylglucosamine diphosphatase LpxI [Alphaproteobacteria bacterium]|jgi:DUF1009 family protein|nr:UDP-2,3-diacylglucosamine diphosphatase LpxI [Alphaproteobacteria bacterium]